MVPFLGLTIKCVVNGNTPQSESEAAKRFPEKIMDCGQGTCMKLSGPNLGSKPLLVCGPGFEDAGATSGCNEMNGITICKCDTNDFCTAEPPSMPFSGLNGIKCIVNGNLPDFDKCNDCKHLDRFAEKTMDCGAGTCGKATGPQFGSVPLYLCAPGFEDGEKSGCNEADNGNFVCRCNTNDFCTKAPAKQSSARRLLSYWSLIAFAVIISL